MTKEFKQKLNMAFFRTRIFTIAASLTAFAVMLAVLGIITALFPDLVVTNNGARAFVVAFAFLTSI